MTRPVLLSTTPGLLGYRPTAHGLEPCSALRPTGSLTCGSASALASFLWGFPAFRLHPTHRLLPTDFRLLDPVPATLPYCSQQRSAGSLRAVLSMQPPAWIGPRLTRPVLHSTSPGLWLPAARFSRTSRTHDFDSGPATAFASNSGCPLRT